VEVEGETKEDAAWKAWNQLDDEDRAPLLAQAAAAERAYEETLAEWERLRKQRQAERGASAARTSNANKTLRVAKTEPAASGSGFDFASESDSGSESEDEVANARWAKKQSAVPPAAPRTPTGRATRSTTGSVPVSDPKASEPKASNEAGNRCTTRGARRDSAGAPGKAAAASKPSSAKASAPRTPGGKRSTAEVAPEARKRLRSASPAPPSALQQPPSWPRAATEPEANANAQHRAVLHMQTHPSKRDAAFPRHPEKLVGAKIQEYFADEQSKPKLYRGTVTKFEYERITGQGLTPLWEVRYDDGDCSEKEWHELKDTLSKWPLAGR